MKRKQPALSLALVLLVAASVTIRADAASQTSSLADQRSINVTIYNDGSALIHDRRSLNIASGFNRIDWRDVSANMDSSSAVLSAISDDARINVLEQNFNYDVLNQNALLHKYVGHEVTIVHPARFAGERDRREPAKILSVDDSGNVVLAYRDRVETTLEGYIEYPRVPQSLRDRPTLSLDLQTIGAGRRDLDLRYLTSGFSWHVDYVGTLSTDESHMDLNGLVGLTNTSGTSYMNARLQLVAGVVNQPPPDRQLKMIAHVTSRASSDVYNVNAQQEDYFGYHLYTIGHPTTILDKQTKQVMLLTAHDIPIVKTLEMRGATYYYQTRNGDLGRRIPVQIIVTFDNRGGDLGIPLPAGQMRIYEDDSRGLSQFLGADNISHTPRNDTVRLHLGDSFDVVGQKKQTDFHLISDCHAASSYEIDLLNGKAADQMVTVVEPMPGDWTISNENQPHTKTSATTATWLVKVPANDKAVLTYTADVTWCRH